MGSLALGSRLALLGTALALAAFPAPASAQASAPAAEPPPLDPPAASPPASPPSFLQPRDARPSAPNVAGAGGSSSTVDEDFLQHASPWVDFSLTSFYLDERVGNFLNVGAQVGVYAFDRLRLSARFATPLEHVDDGFVGSDSAFLPSTPAGFTSTTRVSSRAMSMLYGVSVGLVVTNSKSFVFGPSLTLLRTDVEDYGTAFALSMPFEWTTKRSLRVGFELGLGHAFGGSVRTLCVSGTASCGVGHLDRPGGTAVLFQFNMGWALGRL